MRSRFHWDGALAPAVCARIVGLYAAARPCAAKTTIPSGKWTPGANWRHPEDPQSNPRWQDLIPWCTSPGTTPSRMPSGRVNGCRPRPNGSSRLSGGLEGSPMSGAISARRKHVFANIWQGNFYHNFCRRLRSRTAPVKSFSPNGYGPLRHGGQRVGVVRGLVRPRPLSPPAGQAVVNPIGPTRSNDPH